MAFKPKNQREYSPDADAPTNFPTPRAGSRKARVSLIVDMGTQARDPIWKLGDKVVTEDTPGAVETPQKDVQQVAVFADLVADNVDYGGKIGKAQYRLLLNKSYRGEVTGIAFKASPPMDAKGKRIEGGKWGLHPGNMLSKLATAVGKPEVITSMDLEELLDMPFMATVEVKETPAKNDKKDADGKPVVYKNVNYKAASPVPEDDDGNPIEVAELTQKPRVITFDGAKEEDIQFIRANLRKQIKLSSDYAGSQMQKAVEAYEAKLTEQNGDSDDDKQEEEKPAAKPKPKTTPKAKTQSKPSDDDMDDDVPF